MIITSKPVRLNDIEISVSFDSKLAISPSDDLGENERLRIQAWLDKAADALGKFLATSDIDP